MKRRVRLGIVLGVLWLLTACKSTPEATQSGRSKEEAEAKHAELVRRQEELRRRYASPTQEVEATEGEGTNAQ